MFVKKVIQWLKTVVAQPQTVETPIQQSTPAPAVEQEDELFFLFHPDGSAGWCDKPLGIVLAKITCKDDIPVTLTLLPDEDYQSYPFSGGTFIGAMKKYLQDMGKDPESLEILPQVKFQ